MRVGREMDHGFFLVFIVFLTPDPHPNPLPKREREPRQQGQKKRQLL